MKKIIGSICALATPFRADALDLEAFATLIDYQLAAGTQALVVAGSTGEAHALDQTEFDRLLTFAVDRVAGRVPVLAGTGTANTRKTVQATRRARDLGADAALVVTPYYVRPTQEGMLQHFSEVADQGGLPVVLYNVPSRTACDLLPETVAKLATHARIVGIKEARGEAGRVAELVKSKNPQFSILSGDDHPAHKPCWPAQKVSSRLPRTSRRRCCVGLCDAALAGDAARAQALNVQLTALYELLGAEPNPIPLKWCLYNLGIGTPDLRLPLLPLSPAYHEQAQRVLQGLLPTVAVQARHSSAA